MVAVLEVAELVAERGRSLVVLLNKGDLGGRGGDDAPTSEEVLAEARHRLGFVSWAPLLTLAGRTGLRCARLLPLVERLRAEACRRIPTAELNRDLERWYAAHHPAVWRGKPVRFYYAAQVDVAPPTFLFSVSAAAGVRPVYRRYLNNRLRETYGFEGVPISVRFKTHREVADKPRRRRTGRGRRR